MTSLIAKLNYRILLLFFPIALCQFEMNAQVLDVNFGFLDTLYSGNTEVVFPNSDATTYSATPVMNFGADTLLKVVGDSLNQAQTFLRFDLSSVPDSIEVVDARLVVQPINQVTLTTVENILLTEVEPFVESQVTWATRPQVLQEQFEVGPVGARVAILISDTVPQTYQDIYFDSDYQIGNGKELVALAFDVTQNVQKSIVRNQDEIHFRLQDFERQSNEVLEFLSRESVVDINSIALLIRTRRLFRIYRADIDHSLGVGLSDGSILPYVTGGTQPYTYNWYNSSGVFMSSNRHLQNLEPGWYGLNVTDAAGRQIQMAFIVGIKCEKLNLEFTTNRGYIKEANVSNYFGQTLTNYGLSGRFQTYGEKNSGVIQVDLTTVQGVVAALIGGIPIIDQFPFVINTGRWETVSGLMDFQLWMDNQFIVEKADLILYGDQHQQLNRVTRFRSIHDDWAEYTVNYNNRPRYGALEKNLGPYTSPIPPDLVVNMIDYWNLWKSNNTLNHGFFYDFYDFNSLTTSNVPRMERTFYSTDHNNAMKWPRMSFTLRLENTGGCFSDINQVPYAELKYTLDGGFIYTVGGKVKFVYDSEYKMAPGAYVKYDIRTIQNQVVASADGAGNTQGGAVALQANIDDNRYILDLSTMGLSPGQYYYLTVYSNKGDQKVLKILYR